MKQLYNITLINLILVDMLFFFCLLLFVCCCLFDVVFVCFLVVVVVVCWVSLGVLFLFFVGVFCCWFLFIFYKKKYL